MDTLFSKAALIGNAAMETASSMSKEITMGNLYETCEERVGDIRFLLDSKFDQEKIMALKRLIAMISKGKDVRGFFPDVVKNVASSSFEVRKLVYIYLLRYAELEPDLSLLSINTFQRDLMDRNPMIRAMALRVMSSIKVEMIAPLIMMALKKCAGDMSPYVRKAAANAIPKLYSLDPSSLESLIELIELLLRDVSTLVLGSAILSMNVICPDRFDIVHKHFRKLCTLLIDADEWAQIDILGLMIRYARQFFTDPSGGDLDPDHALLIQSVVPLLQNRNPSVVLAASRLLIHSAPPSTIPKSVAALLRLLATTNAEHQYFVLQNLATIAAVYPTLLQPYARNFFIFYDDASFVKDLKLEILGLLACETNASVIVKELAGLCRSWHLGLVVKCVKLMGVVCTKVPDVAGECLGCLMGLIQSDQDIIVSEAVIVTRLLLQTSTAKNTNLVITLARSLNSISAPQARASILWLIGQNSEHVPKIAQDAFRQSVKNFNHESAPIVKLQILTLGAKLVSLGADVPDARAGAIVRSLFDHVIELARFDASFDVRDRGRFLAALVALADKDDVGGVGLFKERLKGILLAPKVAPNVEIKAGQTRFTLGSLSHSFNVAVKGYAPLPPWSATPKGAAMRNTPDTAVNGTWVAPVRSVSARDQDVKSKSSNAQLRSAFGASGGVGVPPKKSYSDLNNFLESSEEEESEEEEDDDDDEEESEEDDEEESDQDDEESDEEESEDEKPLPKRF
ncbi:AP-3 complex subunit beta-2 [Chytriomyces hyalinus]|nr:AP-3 complex subunit beta-2 [Chytriomyces hyalinus]